MSSLAPMAFPSGDQWKNIAYVTAWKVERRKHAEQKWHSALWDQVFKSRIVCEPGKKFPAAAVELMQFESESLLSHLRRLELVESGGNRKASKHRNNSKSRHQIPSLIARDPDTGSWILAPAARRAFAGKIEKAKSMYEQGLEKKAQRELACGVIGGEVTCKMGHAFRVGYECGNRYCVSCGPRGASRLFAKHRDRLLFVSTRLLMCGDENCQECNQAITEKRIPHWPPARGIRPRMVVAHLDFTLLNPGDTGPEMMRQLNVYIKRFCRAIERRYRMRRSDYGLAYCDELGANNTNAHAHGIYVGPWLPQEKKELSAMWEKITGGSFIISIKYARNFSGALFHAVKYPAKFAQRASPRRLADLEVIFHRVRRFHTLAAFYAPDCPEEEKPAGRKCPLCSEPLSDPSRWETLAELARRGLRDLATVEKEMKLAAVSLPP